MLFKKGAEAHLFKEQWYGRTILKKVRIPKSYRHPVLDERLRIARTIHEAKILSETRKIGISTPVVYYIDVPNATIIMEFIEGKRIKELFYETENKNEEICRQIGIIIGLLHKNNIIHGDITTSNLIFETNTDKMFLIDFGLAEYSTNVEDQGVDLHLIHRVLQSTHIKIVDTSFKYIKKGYEIILGEEKAGKVFQRLEEIELRGRYH